MELDLADAVSWAIMYASTLSPHLRVLGVKIDTHSLDIEWRGARDSFRGLWVFFS